MLDPYFSEEPKHSQEWEPWTLSCGVLILCLCILTPHPHTHTHTHTHAHTHAHTHMHTHTHTHSSVFDGMPIPYPKRKFLSDDDSKDDKTDPSKVHVMLVPWANAHTRASAHPPILAVWVVWVVLCVSAHRHAICGMRNRVQACKSSAYYGLCFKIVWILEDQGK